MKAIFLQYLEWHFFNAPKAILSGWKNFLVFNFRYFSIPLLFRTFFSYWRRFRGSYGRGFDLKTYFEAFTFNLISRVIGMTMRTGLIIFGLLFEAVIFFIGLAIFLVWLVLPLTALLALFVGGSFIFR